MKFWVDLIGKNKESTYPNHWGLLSEVGYKVADFPFATFRFDLAAPPVFGLTFCERFFTLWKLLLGVCVRVPLTAPAFVFLKRDGLMVAALISGLIAVVKSNFDSLMYSLTLPKPWLFNYYVVIDICLGSSWDGLTNYSLIIWFSFSRMTLNMASVYR